MPDHVPTPRGRIAPAAGFLLSGVPLALAAEQSAGLADGFTAIGVGVTPRGRWPPTRRGLGRPPAQPYIICRCGPQRPPEETTMARPAAARAR